MVRMHGNNVYVRMRYVPAGHDEPNFLWLQLIVYDLRQLFHCRHQRVIAVIRQVIEVWLMLLGYHQRVAPIEDVCRERQT